MRNSWGMLVMLLAASVMLTIPTLAQQDSAGDAQHGGGRQISPEGCYVDPMPVEDLISLLGLDDGGIVTVPLMTITSPLGTPADDATTGRISSAVRGLMACINAGDLPRTATWMTSHGIQRVFGSLTIDSATRVAAQARLTAPPVKRTRDQLLRLLAVSDVSVLPDGRVAAFVVFNDPVLPTGGPETVLVVYSPHAGGWFLDDWVDFSIVPLPADAEVTPSP
jgi:hypothetical protein